MDTEGAYTGSTGKKRVLVGYGVDIDAVAGWLGSYGGADSSSDISRGRSFFTLRWHHYQDLRI